MLGSPASPRKRPFELLSDLVDDGGLGEELHPERWDVSSLDEMARFTKLGLGVGGELLACSEEAVLMGRWGRGCQEEEEEEHGTPAHAQEDRKAGGCGSVALTTEVQSAVGGRESAGAEGEVLKRCRVEVYQVAAEEEQKEEEAAAGLEPCHEHNYSLSQGGEEEEPPGQGSSEEGRGKGRDQEEEEDDEVEEEEEEDDGEEETAVEAELSSSSETECGESERRRRRCWRKERRRS